MKCLERIVLKLLKCETNGKLDENQFAYRQNRSVDDAVLTLIHYAHAHLDVKGADYVRILFADFSSAFNTVQPHLLASKLQHFSINPHLSLWVTDFLTDRTQSVRYRNKNARAEQTSIKTINTGAPQGTVISPFLFTLYTNDCTAHSQEASIIKFSDDTAIIDTSDSHTSYEREVEQFAGWCDRHGLDLNVGKTKEMVVDLKSEKKKSTVNACMIKGQEVERVNVYKYLGTTIDSKLSFKQNTDEVFRKCRQRLHILYTLRALKVNKTIMERCYQSFIQSVLAFSMICWFGSLGVREKMKLNSIVRTCEKIIGSKQQTIEEIFRKRATKRVIGIQKDPTHVLAHLLKTLPSGRRLQNFKCRLKRFEKTFIPQSIKLFNSR